MVEDRRETIVAGSRITLAVLVFALAATSAEAQLISPFTGVLSGHLGVASGGDVSGGAAAVAASMLVIDDSGVGVELDAGHNGDFDSGQFTDSSITTVTVNVVYLHPHDRLRPFVSGGAGVVRMRAAFPRQRSRAQTDTAWSAGGGVLYMLNEALGFRADIRYFRQFGRQDTFPLGANGALDFSRFSVGVSYSWPMR